MDNFDFNSLIGLTLFESKKILNKNGYLNVDFDIYSSDKVKKSDTLVVSRVNYNDNSVKLLVGEFLYKLD